jgi:hypothetical protein
VASISANNDTVIGKTIADAFDKVGKDGVITVEEGQTFGLELEFTEGMQFDKGYISPYFITDADRQEAVLEDPYILIANQKIGSVNDLLPVLEKVMQAGKPVLILSEDVEGEALATLVVNKIRGTFASAAVKAPGFGERRKAMLQDIAILTGGTVISEEVGLKLENVSLDMLGRARKVVISKDDTTIVDGAGTESDVAARIKQIEREIENTDSDWDKREAPGASRQAVRRCGRDQGRRRHRGGAEGEEAPHRGRRVGGPCRHRRGHRPRRWRDAAPCPVRHRQDARWFGRREGRPGHRAPVDGGAPPSDRLQRRLRRRRRRREGPEPKVRWASTPPPASTRT